MFNEEAEEGESDLSATRYPCMPSLVSLQMMNNRLHLAYTGKKLMNWTAMATGKELRKLAKELQDIYKSFREDMREGFILLARSRYSSPYFNGIIMENLAKDADIKVELTRKSVSGVKTLQLRIIDSQNDNYAHLGIGRGGETITEAKDHWRELLKNVLLMAQTRITFIALETAYKNANQRKNVITKVVIPRTIASVKYILAELDEMEREHFYRIKKILAIKYRNRSVVKKTQEEIITEVEEIECIVCGRPVQKSAEILNIAGAHVPRTTKGEFGDIVNDTDRQMTETLKPVSLNQMCDDCIVKLKNEQQASATREKTAKEHKAVTIYPEENKIRGEESDHKINSTGKTHETMLDIPNDQKAAPQRNIKDLGLGTFEFEIEEITQIVRTKNADGTVSEQKKIIRRKKERRAPQTSSESLRLTSSRTSTKSNESKDAMTIGVVTVGTTKPWWLNVRRTKSLTLPSAPPKADLEREHSQSLAGFTNNKSIHINFLTNDSYHSICDTCVLVSNSESEELLQLHEIQDKET